MTSGTLVMPKLGLTMTEGRLAEWKVAPGGAFAADATSEGQEAWAEYYAEQGLDPQGNPLPAEGAEATEDVQATDDVQAAGEADAEG